MPDPGTIPFVIVSLTVALIVWVGVGELARRKHKRKDP